MPVISGGYFAFLEKVIYASGQGLEHFTYIKIFFRRHFEICDHVEFFSQSLSFALPDLASYGQITFMTHQQKEHGVRFHVVQYLLVPTAYAIERLSLWDVKHQNATHRVPHVRLADGPAAEDIVKVMFLNASHLFACLVLFDRDNAHHMVTPTPWGKLSQWYRHKVWKMILFEILPNVKE